MTVLQNIDKWKLDAKQEESERYYYHTEQFEELRNGDRNPGFKTKVQFHL